MTEQAILKFSYGAYLAFARLSRSQKQAILIRVRSLPELVRLKKVKPLDTSRLPHRYRHQWKEFKVEFALDKQQVPILLNLTLRAAKAGKK